MDMNENPLMRCLFKYDIQLDDFYNSLSSLYVITFRLSTHEYYYELQSNNAHLKRRLGAAAAKIGKCLKVIKASGGFTLVIK